MDTLFPVELTSAQYTPLIDTATKLFAEHWTGVVGEEISVPAQNSLELVTRVCQEWQANLSRADASATHTAELQAHVAALEERIANPTKEPPAGGPAGAPLTNPGPTPGGVVAPKPDPILNASHRGWLSQEYNGTERRSEQLEAVSMKGVGRSFGVGDNPNITKESVHGLALAHSSKATTGLSYYIN